MKRREFITLLGGAAAAWPLVARAQQTRRVGVLMSLPADDALGRARLTALVDAMQQSGWTDGRNLKVEVRWSSGSPEDYRKHASELVNLAP